jgi:hypothetical protein
LPHCRASWRRRWLCGCARPLRRKRPSSGPNNTGAITQAYATGDVSAAIGAGAAYFVGGLVGANTGAITAAYATGTVIGPNYVDGLVGWNESGAITQAYATGAVSGSGTNIGGLAGANTGAITDAYATGAVSGGTYYVGGLVGQNTGTITQAYALGAVSGSGINIAGLVGYNYAGSTIDQAYASGAVSGSGTNIGGLVGKDTGTITNGYYDTRTTGQAQGIAVLYNVASGTVVNVVGLTTAQFQNGTLPAGFDSAVWRTGLGLYPYLMSLFPNGQTPRNPQTNNPAPSDPTSQVSPPGTTRRIRASISRSRTRPLARSPFPIPRPSTSLAILRLVTEAMLRPRRFRTAVRSRPTTASSTCRSASSMRTSIRSSSCLSTRLKPARRPSSR